VPEKPVKSRGNKKTRKMENKKLNFSLSEQECQDCDKILNYLLEQDIFDVNTDTANDAIKTLLRKGYVQDVGRSKGKDGHQIVSYKITPSGTDCHDKGGFSEEREQRLQKQQNKEENI
jgi:hypothetical protein